MAKMNWDRVNSENRRAIGRMLERATEAEPQPALPGLANVVPGRFCRDASEFATGERAPS